MADGTDRHIASTLVACLVAYAGLGIVMIRVPWGMSGLERVGLWVLFCGLFSAAVFVKTKTWD